MPFSAGSPGSSFGRDRLACFAPVAWPARAHGTSHLRPRERVRGDLHLPGPAAPVPDEVARYLFRRVVSWGRSSSVFLENGARLYLDVGSHPEYATPECDSVQGLTHDKAGERILESLLAAAEARLHEEGIAGQIFLFKNNTDSAGNSYGCHENYLVSRYGEFQRLADVLIPFFVSRQIICGAGKVWRPLAARCCIAQRAEHIWRASPRRPPGRRSSTPATSRTPTPSATAACT